MEAFFPIWGNALGALANGVALEACVQARNEGRLELAAACEVWKEIKFEFLAMDTL